MLRPFWHKKVEKLLKVVVVGGILIVLEGSKVCFLCDKGWTLTSRTLTVRIISMCDFCIILCEASKDVPKGSQPFIDL